MSKVENLVNIALVDEYYILLSYRKTYPFLVDYVIGGHVKVDGDFSNTIEWLQWNRSKTKFHFLDGNKIIMEEVKTYV